MRDKEQMKVMGERLRDGLKRYRLIAVVLVAGVVLMAIPTGSERNQSAKSTDSEKAETFNIHETEKRLSDTLSKVEGAGQVTVMLTTQNGTSRILAEDREFSQKDSGEEKQTSTVLVSKGSGNQEPVTLQEIYPSYQGALLVCAGGDNPEVKLKLVEAVSALTGLGADKISVCKGK